MGQTVSPINATQSQACVIYIQASLVLSADNVNDKHGKICRIMQCFNSVTFGKNNTIL